MEVSVLSDLHAANVSVVRPDPELGDLDRAATAWDQARRTTAPFLLHDADPLVLVAQAWARRFDGTGPAGELEVAVTETLRRWRARSLELPDYFLVVDPEAFTPTIRHWYLGVLGSAAPVRVVPLDRAVTDVLARLQSGPWWPELVQLLDGIDHVIPDRAGRDGSPGAEKRALLI
jgi:hypothetical protein